jgi:ankyrin repeat protein
MKGPAMTPKSPSSDQGPSVLGFGGFYAYAAAYWTSHFSAVSPEQRPDTRKLVRLCSKGSRRLQNWVEQWRRPSGSYIPELDFPEHMSALDPLVIAAMFGPAATVADLLLLKLDSSVLTKDSAWAAVGHLIRRGDIALLKTLVQDEALRPVLCCCKFLYTVISAGQWAQRDDDDDGAGTRNWEEIFDFLIRHLREDLLDCGNDMLRRAARSGCLLLIKRLFHAADNNNDPELRHALLRVEDSDPRRDRDGFQGEHQSIGEAAYEGHAEVVRFLCAQPGLESHLRFVNHQGHTVFHLAVRRPREDVLRTLIRHWPEGINLRNRYGHTPLTLLLFDRTVAAEAGVMQWARILLREGGADAKANEDEDGRGCSSALCHAVRGGHTAVLRMLVEEGAADAYQAVGVDEVTGRPFLRRGVDTWQDEEHCEEMLRLLCSLLPLAVSVDYLR